MRNVTLPSDYINEVETITANGATITKKFQTLADRWETFTTTNGRIQDELNDAISDPEVSAEELARLNALAVAAQLTTPVHKATVRNEAGAHMLRLLRDEYATVAAANYETIREAFNTKAAQLTEALDIADPEASAEEMVRASAKVRAAWADSPILANELETLVSLLHTAATLAGKADPTGGIAKRLIGLTVNTTGLHRRRVWEAWENTTGRAGHWRELWKLGATIEAPALEEVTTYTEPKPMEVHSERKGFGIVQFDHDPEDDTHREYVKDQAQKEASGVGIRQFDYTDEGTGVHIN